MSEFLFRRGTATAALILGGLAGAGCATTPDAVRANIVTEPNCADNPEDQVSITFGGIMPDERILVGNIRADGSKVYGDAVVTVNPEGVVTAASSDRSDIQNPQTPQIQTEESGGIHVTTGDEVYDVSATPNDEGGFDVSVNGQCTAAAQGLGHVASSGIPRVV